MWSEDTNRFVETLVPFARGGNSITRQTVILRSDLQHKIVTIPKSVHAERIAENAAIFDFELSESDMAAIDALERNQRVGADPMNFGF